MRKRKRKRREEKITMAYKTWTTNMCVCMILWVETQFTILWSNATFKRIFEVFVENIEILPATFQIKVNFPYIFFTFILWQVHKEKVFICGVQIFSSLVIKIKIKLSKRWVVCKYVGWMHAMYVWYAEIIQFKRNLLWKMSDSPVYFLIATIYKSFIDNLWWLMFTNNIDKISLEWDFIFVSVQHDCTWYNI